MTRDEPTSSHMSSGVKVALNGGQTAEGLVVKDESELFVSQMKAAQRDKNTCLNCLNTSFMLSLSYKMIPTQVTKHQWNKTISLCYPSYPQRCRYCLQPCSLYPVRTQGLSKVSSQEPVFSTGYHSYDCFP